MSDKTLIDGVNPKYSVIQKGRGCDPWRLPYLSDQKHRLSPPSWRLCFPLGSQNGRDFRFSDIAWGLLGDRKCLYTVLRQGLPSSDEIYDHLDSGINQFEELDLFIVLVTLSRY